MFGVNRYFELPTLEELASLPQWYLSGFDFKRGLFNYIETSRKVLEETAFHDGRSPMYIESSRIVQIGMDEAVEFLPLDSGEPLSIIAHTSFCGSTLLARMIDANSRLLSYREPQVLVDLANCKASDSQFSNNEKQWKSILKFVFGQFTKRWPDQILAYTKPSNWANTILPDLFCLDMDFRLVAMNMPLRDYLMANIRGGKERIGYSLNLLNHISKNNVNYVSKINQIDRMGAPPMQRVLYLLAYCYYLQSKLMDEICTKFSSSKFVSLSKADVTSNPAKSMEKVTKIFGAMGEVSKSIIPAGSGLKFHAKSDMNVAFSYEDELKANALILKSFGNEIDSACRISFEQFD